MLKKAKFACLSFSGGMDSASLLIHLLARDYEVWTLSFLYGQKQLVELDYAEKLIAYLHDHGYKVKHQRLNLDGLGPLLTSALTEDDKPIPLGHYSQENMRDTVVPNRNKIFISILQAVALSLALKKQEKVDIAMGIHAGDYLVYPDTRADFIKQDYAAFCSGNWESHLVSNYLPYLGQDKYAILQDGLASCERLGLDFDEVYKRTLTSYQPNSSGIADFKTASSIARIEAFLKLGRKDPLLYADEKGEVSWEEVVAWVNSVLEKVKTN